MLPKGYTAGIALCFGLAATRLMQGHPIAMTAAQADRNDADEDALSWYRDGVHGHRHGQFAGRHRHAAGICSC